MLRKWKYEKELKFGCVSRIKVTLPYRKKPIKEVN